MKRVCLCLVFIFSLLILSSRASAELVPCDLDENEQCMEISLPCTEQAVYGDAGWYGHSCVSEVIQIPSGRPIYAFLVNGFDQNHNLDMFHFYNFAKCIFRHATAHGEKAYVHFAWWNNLLAPYMEAPLHNGRSVPGPVGPLPLNELHDYLAFTYDPDDPDPDSTPNKAVPAEDYQFQKDAKTVLEVIREYNPDATIILVGHSMGGDAVIRLADSMPSDFTIDLLAPIDPVGNRTCLPSTPGVTTPAQMGPSNTTCHGAFNFTRFQATHDDWNWYPYRTSFEAGNVEYLYHRWQHEAAFPFDFGCPNRPELCPWQAHMLDSPSDEAELPFRYLLRHNDVRGLGINEGSINVQQAIQMNGYSGTDVFPNPLYYWNYGGTADGHGEIVGFRALIPWLLAPQSYPLALNAAVAWPGLDEERLDPNPAAVRALRVSVLRGWENNPVLLDDALLAPQKPPKAYCDARDFAYDGDYCTYCMVSGDLCTILYSTPVADAGPDQTIEGNSSSSTEVVLEGSSSSDPNGYPLTFVWSWLEGTTPFELAGQTVYASLPLGTHEISLTVDNGDYIDTDTVVVVVPEPGAEASTLTALAVLVVMVAVRAAKSRATIR